MTLHFCVCLIYQEAEGSLRQFLCIVYIPGLDNIATHMKEVREEIVDISRFFRELRRTRKKMRVSLLFVGSLSQGFEVWCGDSICPLSSQPMTLHLKDVYHTYHGTSCPHR